MQKKILLIFSLFLVFGILLGSPLVLADDDGTSLGEPALISSDDSDEDNSDKDSDEKNSYLGDRDSDDNDSEERTREKIRLRERIDRELGDGSKIRVEREFRQNEDGTFELKIKRKFTDADGNEITRVMIIERNEDGTKRTLKVEGVEGLEVETELEIEEGSEGNESNDARIVLSNGRRAAIKIMPDTASQVALDRLMALNFSRIELKEVRHNGEARAVYEIDAEKAGRFLGLFKIKLRLQSQVDSETGEVLRTGKPWWAFLVSGEDSDQTTTSE